jgi:hypothetical protein
MRLPASAESWLARPAMKQPATFNTGDPSYLSADSTPGSVSPTDLTTSNSSAGCRFMQKPVL